MLPVTQQMKDQVLKEWDQNVNISATWAVIFETNNPDPPRWDYDFCTGFCEAHGMRQKMVDEDGYKVDDVRLMNLWTGTVLGG